MKFAWYVGHYTTYNLEHYRDVPHPYLDIWFTLGQHWSSDILVPCVCLCVYVCMCVCVCSCVSQPELVRTMTHHPFKIGSPNLDQSSKYFKIHIFVWNFVALTLTFKVKCNLKVHFEVACTKKHYLLKPLSPNLDQRCKTPWLRSPLLWGTWPLALGQLTLRVEI